VLTLADAGVLELTGYEADELSAPVDQIEVYGRVLARERTGAAFSRD
jgi:hypothetical protein